MTAALPAGRLIVFEGGEGTGKTTQARLLAEAIAATGAAVTLTREPGGAPGAEALRRLLLDPREVPHWDPLSEVLLHYAARREHVEKTIRPALARGAWVICDRFCDSTLAYQGAGLGVDAALILGLQTLVLGGFTADLTLVLDLPQAQADRRRAGRAQARGCPEARDRYEARDRAFHERVGACFRAIGRDAGPDHALVDAAGDPAEVHARIAALLRDRFGIDVVRPGARPAAEPGA